METQKKMIVWNEELDDILINTVDDCRATGSTVKKSMLLACEVLDEQHQLPVTYDAVKSRYYYIKDLRGETLRDRLPQSRRKKDNIFPDAISTDTVEVGISELFMEMKKIIKERDDLKVKYEEALLYKDQYEEIKKKLAKIEKESVSLLGLIKEKVHTPEAR